MARKIYLGIAFVALITLVLAFVKQDKPTEVTDFPWHIEHPTAETTRIFGLTLGESNAREAEQHFKEDAKPILFKSPGGQFAVEVFFEEVNLAGLKSRIVLSIAVPDSELQGMFDRGVRMNATGSGKEITLTPEDIARVFSLPISSLTYMPATRLEDSVFDKRFGQPAMKVKEKAGGAVHWLYPQNGLDITLGGIEKPLLQYIAPKNFDKLTQPLLAHGEIIK
jgi:hypothetical protein